MRLKSFVPFLLLFPLLFTACDESSERKGNYMFFFYPREVKYMWSDYVALEEVIYKGEFAGYWCDENFDGGSYPADLIMPALYTSNFRYDTLKVENAFKDPEDIESHKDNWPPLLTHKKPLEHFQSNFINQLTDEGDPLLEMRLKDSYDRYHTRDSEWSAPPVDQEYRLTEIRQLTITCNHTLFGLAPGQPLNDYFNIYSMDPACIIAGNGNIVADHRQTAAMIKEGLSIDEWLSYRPRSAAYFYFRLHTLPPELPVNDVVFNFAMETVDGELLECSGRPVTLTK